MTLQRSAHSFANHQSVTRGNSSVSAEKQPHSAMKLALTVFLSIWRSAEGLYKEMRSRQALEDMLAFDDALLRDMGVSRADVHRAIRRPISESAGENLAEVSRRSRYL